MSLLSIDWTQFFAALPLYMGMPVGARRFFNGISPSQPVARLRFGVWLEPLVASGLMSPGVKGVNFSVKPEYREFSRTIRFMARSRILASPSLEAFQLYLHEHLNTSELAALLEARFSGRADRGAPQEVFSVVTAASWHRRFLAAEGMDWELKYRNGNAQAYTAQPGVLPAAQNLVRRVLDEKGAVPLSRIPEWFPGVGPVTLSAAVNTAFRYLLVFPALRPDTFEPVIGAWPGVAERLFAKGPTMPAPVEAGEIFHAPFLMDDMVAVLSSCVVEPMRLRSGDSNIFAATRQALAAGLGSLPAWVEGPLACHGDNRITMALEVLAAFAFMKESGRPGSTFCLRPTEKGTRWLALGAKERLKALLVGFRGDPDEDSLYGREQLTVLCGLHSLGLRISASALGQQVIESWASAPGGSFIRLADFLSFQTKANNPLVAAAAVDRYFTLILGGRYIHTPTEAQIEGAWQHVLYTFFRLRLIPLGGVQLTVEPGGKELCFTLTGIGACLLGKAADFELASDAAPRILIQPNFDVVFLAPSARMESEIARFAERKGRHIGTLFRITKSSILAAAGAGIGVSSILATLRENCQSGIPANVATEIAGWFGRYRQVDIRPAVLIHCPDEETATRVLAALGRGATRIGGTLLEFHQGKIPPAVAKKLRETGVFIRSNVNF